jgi:hypothetical protein
MEEKTIELHVKIRTKELFSFLLHHTYTSISGLFGLAVSLISLGILATGYAKGDDFRTIVLLVLGLLFTVINPVMLFGKAKKQALTNPLYKKELVYRLDEKGITLVLEEASETVPWENIRKWKKTGKIEILYTSPIHAVLLPFASMEGKRSEVEALLQERLKK